MAGSSGVHFGPRRVPRGPDHPPPAGRATRGRTSSSACAARPTRRPTRCATASAQMLEGKRVRDLAAPRARGARRRAAAPVPADARGRLRRTRTPGARSTSAPPPSQEMAELLAHVLGFDGAVGLALRGRRRRLHRAAPAAPFTYREGKAEAMRELAAREGIDLAASYAYSDSESDLPMLRAVGHPVAVNPDASWRGSRARRAGRSCASSASAGACAWSAAALGAAAVGGRRLPARCSGCAAMSLHELTDEQREIRALARRFADEEIAPHAAAWDREHRFPREVFARARRARADGRLRARGARRRRRRLPLLRARARGARRAPTPASA